LQDKIVFLGGDASYEQLADYYRAARVVAVPSLSESFSLVTAEVLAVGAIIAASDIPGIRGRIINKCGFLLPVNDEDAWARGLNMILNLSDEERRIISDSARAAAQKYSLDEHVMKLKEIYNNL
jgi:D-inositol-3-phosphate glycosyltransferase